MDYSYDKCLYFFSDGQAARANYFIANDPQLNSIVNSNCIAPAITNKGVITSEPSKNTFFKIADKHFSLYPTITSGKLALSTDNSKAGKAEILIFDQTGILVMKQSIFMAEGNSINSLNAGKLVNGSYILQLNSAEEKSTRKFIIQH